MKLSIFFIGILVPLLSSMVSEAQVTTAYVVTSCGSESYSAGISLPITQDETGQICVNDAGTGGTVTSVTNVDGTITISPTTGSVVSSLALGHANTWTGIQTFTTPVLGAATGTSITLSGAAKSTTLTLTSAAPTVSAGQIGFGGTTAAASNCGTLITAVACIVVNIAGTVHYIPYY